MMSNGCNKFDDDLIELYSLGVLDRLQGKSFEEHYLLCESCQERLLTTDDFVVTMKSALAEWIRRKPARAAMATFIVVAGGLYTFSISQVLPAGFLT
ncbi:MAG TPA: hypothetical protein VMJ34_08645 [Bryobacteraceae bacterium]|nr:hypothetical protein [Bryobacteraceae bacterium]